GEGPGRLGLVDALAPGVACGAVGLALAMVVDHGARVTRAQLGGAVDADRVDAYAARLGLGRIAEVAVVLHRIAAIQRWWRQAFGRRCLRLGQWQHRAGSRTGRRGGCRLRPGLAWRRRW